MKDLIQCRAELDEIDAQLVSLFEQRMHVSTETIPSFLPRMRSTDNMCVLSLQAILQMCAGYGNIYVEKSSTM